MMRAIPYILALLASAYMAGCSPPPTAPSMKLRPAPEWAANACEPLPDIPENQGDPAVRRGYDAATRTLYVACAAKHWHMVKRDRIVTKAN